MNNTDFIYINKWNGSQFNSSSDMKGDLADIALAFNICSTLKGWFLSILAPPVGFRKHFSAGEIQGSLKEEITRNLLLFKDG